MKMLEVAWVDSNMNRGWSTVKETKAFLEKQTLICKSVGYLYEETDEYLSLVMSQAWQYAEDKDAASYAELLTIPREAVKDTKEIK